MPFLLRPEAVREVIYGCRCSLYYELQALLRETRYAHVSLISATVDREKYKLNFSDFPRSTWDHRMIDAVVAAKEAERNAD